MAVNLLTVGTFLAWGLCGTASAADRGEAAAEAVPEAEAAVTAGPFGGRGPAETIQDELDEKKSKEQLETEARLKAIEDAQKARLSRVVVLQYKGTDTDFRNEALQRNIKSRIARPDAKFFPEIDLYQAGRKEPDRSVRHTDQQATVSDDAIPRILDAVDDVSSIPWNALSEQDWGLRANDLLQMADQLWFVDRVELREPLFLLYAQIGRAAENANNPSPPYFEQVGKQAVNYFYYLAGAMAYKDPQLLSKLTDMQLNASVSFYKDQLDAGKFEPLTLSFDIEGDFDVKAFATDYQVFINGLEETIKNPDGLLDVPPGRVDVYLKRSDGHSLSDHIDLEKLTDRFYFVRQNARKKMGLDFQDQLLSHPNECIPQLDGDILNYLSIYGKLHPQAEIYIAVPYAGSTAPGRIYLWRWDRAQSNLVRIQDNTGGFPIRFAALIGAGLAFNGVDIQTPTNEELQGLVDAQQPGAQVDPASTLDALSPIPNPVIDGVPVYYQLRGHYNRLMMGVGIEFKIGFGGGGEKPFADLYQTNGNTAVKFDEVECTVGTADCPTGTKVTQVVALRERSLQRLVYGVIGVVLGRDAAVGFGPRGYFRTGWYNAPHAVDFTLHAGYTGRVAGKGRKDEERSGRVRVLLDADFYGGVMAPYHDSLYIDPTTHGKFMALGTPFATFGFTVGAGLTF